MAIHRLQCAAMTSGCTSVLVFEADNAGIDHLGRPAGQGDRHVDGLLRAVGWRLDHGRWICGAHGGVSL